MTTDDEQIVIRLKFPCSDSSCGCADFEPATTQCKCGHLEDNHDTYGSEMVAAAILDAEAVRESIDLAGALALKQAVGRMQQENPALWDGDHPALWDGAHLWAWYQQVARDVVLAVITATAENMGGDDQ